MIIENCTIIMADKNKEKLNEIKEEIIKEIKKEENNENKQHNIIILPLDKNNLNNIKSFVQSFNSLNLPLNYLININSNNNENNEKENSYGHEINLANNYLNNYYLIMLLTPKLIKSNNGIIINISNFNYCLQHLPSNFNFNWIENYYQNKEKEKEKNNYNLNSISKSCLILFCKEYNLKYNNEENNYIKNICIDNDNDNYCYETCLQFIHNNNDHNDNDNDNDNNDNFYYCNGGKINNHDLQLFDSFSNNQNDNDNDNNNENNNNNNDCLSQFSHSFILNTGLSF